MRAQASAHRLLVPLDELLALTDGLLPERGVRNLAAARDRLATDRFNLVVLGEFKRGKSTLINALLERELLPTGVVPLTSVVTVLGWGERERLLVTYANGDERERPIDELPSYVTEAENPGNRLGVELARVELDHGLLGAGLELVDTPGIGSIHGHNTAVARGFLPRVDAALCVLDAGQPLSEGERALFAEAAARVPRLLIVVNKIDHLSVDEREVAVEFIRSALELTLGHPVEDLFVVSARAGDGLAPLAERLGRLATDEREAVLRLSVAGLAASAAVEGAQAARFEAHAIELPLDELRRRMELFGQRIPDLPAAGEEAGDLLDRGVQRALTELVNEPLRDLARQEQPRLHAELRRHIQELGSRSPRELSRELEEFVEVTIRREFETLAPRFEAAIAGQLSGLEHRYAARVRELLEEVQAVAEEVFGARAGDFLPETGLREPSRFTFKLEDVEHALDVIVGFGRTVTPGALGRRLVIRDAEQRLLEMTDRHAGRLRSELAQRATEAARGYRRELAAAVEDAIAAIQQAIDRAAADRRQGERHAHDRLEQLQRISRRCGELATEFYSCASGSAADAVGGGQPAVK